MLLAPKQRSVSLRRPITTRSRCRAAPAVSVIVRPSCSSVNGEDDEQHPEANSQELDGAAQQGQLDNTEQHSTQQEHKPPANAHLASLSGPLPRRLQKAHRL
jgi:hypothetical protein